MDLPRWPRLALRMPHACPHLAAPVVEVPKVLVRGEVLWGFWVFWAFWVFWDPVRSLLQEKTTQVPKVDHSNGISYIFIYHHLPGDLVDKHIQHTSFASCTWWLGSIEFTMSMLQLQTSGWWAKYVIRGGSSIGIQPTELFFIAYLDNPFLQILNTRNHGLIGDYTYSGPLGGAE